MTSYAHQEVRGERLELREILLSALHSSLFAYLAGGVL